MAYGYGTAAGPDGLLEALEDFLSVNGWDINRWDTIDHSYTTGAGISGLGKQLCVSKTNSYGDTMYFNLRSCSNNCRPLFSLDTTTATSEGIRLGFVTGLVITSSTGYDAGLAWDLQPGCFSISGLGTQSMGSCLTGVFSSADYWIVQHGDCVTMVVEVSAGRYYSLSFGTFVRQGVAAGCGIYFSAAHGWTRPQTQHVAGNSGGLGVSIPTSGVLYYSGNGGVYCTSVDGATGWRPIGWKRLNTSSGSDTVYYGQMTGRTVEDNYQSYGCDLIRAAYIGPFAEGVPSNASQITPMCPIHCLLYRGPYARFSILGLVQGVRYINTKGLTDKESFTIGSDTWKVFTSGIKSKYVLSPDILGYHGIAILTS
jgi:hypothetical protein